MTLTTIIKEAENSLEKILADRDSDMYEYYKSVFLHGFEGGYPMGWNDNFKSFLTEQITKAVNSALEATRLEPVLETHVADCEEIHLQPCESKKAVAEQAKKIERFKE